MKDKTVYTCTYKSKLGDILLAADAIGLTGLWFEGQKYFANILPDGAISQESLILTEAKRWLDIYFSGLYSAAASDWLRISTGGVEDFIANSVWTDDYLWGDCKKAGKDAECVPYVRAGGRRCSGA